jgi:hypothetical protein
MSSKKESKLKSKPESKPKKKLYAVFEEEYKNTPVINIYEVDKKGEKVGEKPFPIISMGARKWEIAMAHRHEIKEILSNQT